MIPETNKQKALLVSTVPVIIAVFFIIAAFQQGNAGFKVDKTQHGLKISGVYNHLNPVRSGDLIVAINDLPYDQVLGHLLLHDAHADKISMTILRDHKQLKISLQTIPFTFSALLFIIWPHLLFFVVYLSLGLTALLRAPPDKTTTLFYLMTLGFSCSIATTLASNAGIFSPRVISVSFFGITIFNWLAFGLWAHFVSTFPKERDITEKKPWLPHIYYFLPPALSILTALALADDASGFWEWLQRLRNIFLPLIIVGAFIKHLMDYLRLPNTPSRNQIKYPLVAYWLSFGPYLFLYLLPNLWFNNPLIHFRTAILAFLILPLAYLFALMRYRLFDVDKMLSRVIAYIILIISITLLYSAFLIMLKRWLWGKGVLTEDLFLIFMVAVIALFNPSVNRIQKIIYRYILRNNPISASILNVMSQKISSALEISAISDIITNDMPRQFSFTKAALAVIKREKIQLFPQNSSADQLAAAEVEKLLAQFEENNEIHLHQISPINPLTAKLLKNGWSVVFKLQGASLPVGLLFIGEKTNGKLFNGNDINLLATLANQVGIALENVLRYERLIQSKKQQAEMFGKLVQSEKMATIGEMASTLAHELKNPLAVIRSSAQYVAEVNKPTPSSKEMLEYIVDEVDALSHTINSLLGHARHRPPVFKPVNIEDSVIKTLKMWKNSLDHKSNISITHNIQEGLPSLHCDINQINQILLNMIRNAEEAIDQSGNIFLIITKEHDNVLIRVLDTGAGFDRKVIDHIFTNFFTTKSSGVGLGLAVCRQLAHAHHGSIRVKNRLEGGAEVILSLPFLPNKLPRAMDMPLSTQLS